MDNIYRNKSDDIEEFNVKNLAEYTGLTQRTIYNLVSRGKIPFIRLSPKKVVFNKSDIDKWNQSRRKKRKAEAPVLEQETLGVQFPAAQDNSDSASEPKKKQSFRRAHVLKNGILAIVLISMGLAGGLIIFPRNTKNMSSARAKNFYSTIDPVLLANQGKISSLDYTPSGADKSVVHVKMDYLSQPVELNGAAFSPQIKPLLIKALKGVNGDYSIKSKSIDIIKPYFLDPEIRSTLIYVLKHESNALIRMKAMMVLSEAAKSQDVKDVLLDRLKNDENVSVRFKALELIENSLDDQLVAWLKALGEKETNDIIKNRIDAISKGYTKTI